MRLVRLNLVFLALGAAAAWTLYCLVVSATAIAELTAILQGINPEALISPQVPLVLALWFWAAPFSAFIGLAIILRPNQPAPQKRIADQPTEPASRIEPPLPERPV